MGLQFINMVLGLDVVPPFQDIAVFIDQECRPDDAFRLLAENLLHPIDPECFCELEVLIDQKIEIQVVLLDEVL